MIREEAWKPSVVLGTIFMFAGIVPFVLWVLDYMDVIRPEEDPTHWGIIVVSAALLSFGLMLANGKGSSISEAFMSWFKRKSDG
jgi:hypothetical protein